MTNMNIDPKILRIDERVAHCLRTLYHRFGYCHYKMSKFEEYSLYAKNTDFLGSDAILSFTDTTGRLMALKPDVTLSIISNSKDIPGQVQKVYYDEKCLPCPEGHTLIQRTKTNRSRMYGRHRHLRNLRSDNASH